MKIFPTEGGGVSLQVITPQSVSVLEFPAAGDIRAERLDRLTGDYGYWSTSSHMIAAAFLGEAIARSTD